MPRFLRQRLAHLRLPALAVLLLAVMANPLLAALGDLHELGSGNEHLHSSAEHAAGDAGHDRLDAGHEDGGLLHALMHASHCCGHPTAVVPGSMLSLALLPAAAPAAPATRPQPAMRPDSPLRPPIAA